MTLMRGTGNHRLKRTCLTFLLGQNSNSIFTHINKGHHRFRTKPKFKFI